MSTELCQQTYVNWLPALKFDTHYAVRAKELESWKLPLSNFQELQISPRAGIWIFSCGAQILAAPKLDMPQNLTHILRAKNLTAHKI
jgi:hypothetical protein